VFVIFCDGGYHMFSMHIFCDHSTFKLSKHEEKRVIALQLQTCCHILGNSTPSLHCFRQTTGDVYLQRSNQEQLPILDLRECLHSWKYHWIENRIELLCPLHECPCCNGCSCILSNTNPHATSMVRCSSIFLPSQFSQ
jgi:hypothetical protein